MADWNALLGPELVTKDGLKPTSDVLKGKKRIGIYFSAHWVRACLFPKFLFNPAFFSDFCSVHHVDHLHQF
jgi:hypothetical protein